MAKITDLARGTIEIDPQAIKWAADYPADNTTTVQLAMVDGSFYYVQDTTLEALAAHLGVEKLPSFKEA